MQLINLSDSVERYKAESNNKKQKRTLWSEFTKDLIFNTLTQIAKKHAIGWTVELIGSSTNLEGITLTFGDIVIGTEPSIEEPLAKEQDNVAIKYYTKHEGTLAFSQAYNGDIFIIHVYPSIEEIVSHRDSQKLEMRMDPSKITAEFVEQQVAVFLDSIIKWESSPLYNDIGFVVKR